MRTNIVLDDKLVEEAFKYVNVKTKRDLVDYALRELVEHHRKLDMRKIRGKVGIRSDYDYKKLRTG